MLLLLIRTVDAIDLEGPRCASIVNRLFNMFPKKSTLAVRARDTISVVLLGLATNCRY